MRIHSVRRGYDPRECALVAFGGAGPLHALRDRQQLEIAVILLPPAPGITSAMGLLATDLKYDSIRTVGVMLAEAEREALEGVREMERELRARFAATATSPSCTARPPAATPVRATSSRSTATPSARTGASCSATSFHDRHRREYGFDFPGDPVEIINLRVIATGAIPPGRTPPSPAGDGDPRRRATGTTPSSSPRRRGARGARRAHVSTARACAPGTAARPRRSCTRWTRPSSISPGWDGVVPPTARSGWSSDGEEARA